jgi:hypothetical protein
MAISDPDLVSPPDAVHYVLCKRCGGVHKVKIDKNDKTKRKKRLDDYLTDEEKANCLLRS